MLYLRYANRYHLSVVCPVQHLAKTLVVYLSFLCGEWAEKPAIERSDHAIFYGSKNSLRSEFQFGVWEKKCNGSDFMETIWVYIIEFEAFLLSQIQNEYFGNLDI